MSKKPATFKSQRHSWLSKSELAIIIEVVNISEFVEYQAYRKEIKQRGAMLQPQDFERSLLSGAHVIYRETAGAESKLLDPKSKLNLGILRLGLEPLLRGGTVLREDGGGVRAEIISSFFIAAELLPKLGQYERLSEMCRQTGETALMMSVSLQLSRLVREGDHEAIRLWAIFERGSDVPDFRKYSRDLASCLIKSGDAYAGALGELYQEHITSRPPG